MASLNRAALERALELVREWKRRHPWAPIKGPQTQAYNSRADITGYGGAAGGGKTDLIAGLSLEEHERVLILRREKAQTEGIIQRFDEILGNRVGFNSQKSIWHIPGRSLIEFGGLDNIGDESRWQGRPHDLKCFDECTEMREHQVRFVMGWTRTNKPGLHPRVLMTFNPPTSSEGRWIIGFFAPWLDKKHPMYPTPYGELRYAAMLPGADGESRDVWLDRPDKFVLVNGEPSYDYDPKDYSDENIITPKSRTFIPAKVTDNPYYMSTGYMSTLQALPEPLRSQMLYGDFMAGVTDDEMQVIPTEWVDAAMTRWKPLAPKPPMDSLGVDVARGGKDNTIISPRHGQWYDHLKAFKGAETPDGPSVAGLAIATNRDNAPIHIDVIGVGASPYDFLVSARQQVVGVNVAEKATTTDKSGRLHFFNLRSQLWWQMREDLDPANNTGIALPPDELLKADLCAPLWRLQGSLLKVESRDEIIARIGRSPDRASALILARIDTPKASVIRAASKAREQLRGHDPYANLG